MTFANVIFKKKLKKTKKHPNSLNKTAKSSTQRLHCLPILKSEKLEIRLISHGKIASIDIPDDTPHSKVARPSSPHTRPDKIAIRRYQKIGNSRKNK
jgi:hypothetical protein